MPSPTHRKSGTRTYRIWQLMKNRCHNPDAERFPYYGARGITVCDRWRGSFAAFLADMGEAPDGTSIDRIDNGGNYEPGNCRWATKTEQNRNTRQNRLLTIFGVTKCVAEWAEESGTRADRIFSRLWNGWPEGEAVFGRNEYTRMCAERDQKSVT